jgi:hypothetical protein
MENITNNDPPTIIAKHESSIHSLLFDRDLNILWAGDFNGVIFQYCRGRRNGWRIQSKYLNLGIGWAQSLTRFGNLLFVGGNLSKIRVINIVDKEVLPEIIEVAIQYISSLKICEVSPFKTYLAAIGTGPCYLSDKTDIFDVSKFQEIQIIKKIFTNPEHHIKAIYNQSNKVALTQSNNSGRCNQDKNQMFLIKKDLTDYN